MVLVAFGPQAVGKEPLGWLLAREGNWPKMGPSAAGVIGVAALPGPSDAMGSPDKVAEG